MRMGKGVLAGLLILATSMLPLTVEAGLGRVAARGAVRSTARALRRSTQMPGNPRKGGHHG